METRGQGGLELLLLIGGVVLVAGFVMMFVLGNAATGSGTVQSGLGAADEAKAAAGFDTTMVVSSSFEKETTAAITGGTSVWFFNGAPGPIDIVSSGCYNGQRCLFLNAGGANYAGVYQYIDIVPGKTYVATAYQKGVCHLHLHLGGQDLDSGGPTTRGFEYDVGNPVEWTKISGTFTTNPGEVKARIYAARSTIPLSGYCDLVTLKAQ